jgi:cytochrome c
MIVLDDAGPSLHDPVSVVNDKMAALEKFNNMAVRDTEQAADRRPAMVFEQRCAACHLLNGTSEIGPYLNGLLGREVGSASDYTYSDVLYKDKRKWDTVLLRSFLTEPRSEFMGNRMNKIELTESEVNKLIRFFESQKTE